MKNAPTRGSSSATVPIPKIWENMRPRTAATSWWHKSLRYKQGDSHLEISCWAGFGPSQCHCFCQSPMIIPGMAGEERETWRIPVKSNSLCRSQDPPLRQHHLSRQGSATWVESKSSTARGLELDDHKGPFLPKPFYDSSWKGLSSPARAAQGSLESPVLERFKSHVAVAPGDMW